MKLKSMLRRFSATFFAITICMTSIPVNAIADEQVEVIAEEASIIEQPADADDGVIKELITEDDAEAKVEAVEEKTDNVTADIAEGEEVTEIEEISESEEISEIEAAEEINKEDIAAAGINSKNYYSTDDGITVAVDENLDVNNIYIRYWDSTAGSYVETKIEEYDSSKNSDERKSSEFIYKDTIADGFQVVCSIISSGISYNTYVLGGAINGAYVSMWNPFSEPIGTIDFSLEELVNIQIKNELKDQDVSLYYEVKKVNEQSGYIDKEYIELADEYESVPYGNIYMKSNGSYSFDGKVLKVVNGYNTNIIDSGFDNDYFYVATIGNNNSIYNLEISAITYNEKVVALRNPYSDILDIYYDGRKWDSNIATDKIIVTDTGCKIGYNNKSYEDDYELYAVSDKGVSQYIMKLSAGFNGTSNSMSNCLWYDDISYLEVRKVSFPGYGKTIDVNDQTDLGFEIFNNSDCTDKFNGKVQSNNLYIEPSKEIPENRNYIVELVKNDKKGTNIINNISVDSNSDLPINIDVRYLYEDNYELLIREANTYNVSFDEQLDGEIDFYYDRACNMPIDIAADTQISEGTTIFYKANPNIDATKGYELKYHMDGVYNNYLSFVDENYKDIINSITINGDINIFIDKIYNRAEFSIDDDSYDAISSFINVKNGVYNKEITSGDLIGEYESLNVNLKDFTPVKDQYLELYLTKEYTDGQKTVMTSRLSESNNYGYFGGVWGNNRELKSMTLSGKFVDNPTITIIDATADGSGKTNIDFYCEEDQVSSGDSLSVNSRLSWVNNADNTNYYLDIATDEYNFAMIAYPYSIKKKEFYVGWKDITITIKDLPEVMVDFDTTKLGRNDKVSVEVNGEIVDISKPLNIKAGDGIEIYPNENIIGDNESIKVSWPSYEVEDVFDTSGFVPSNSVNFISGESSSYSYVYKSMTITLESVANKTVTIKKPADVSLYAYAELLEDESTDFCFDEDDEILTISVPAGIKLEFDCEEEFYEKALRIIKSDINGEESLGYLIGECPDTSVIITDDSIISFIYVDAYVLSGNIRGEIEFLAPHGVSWDDDENEIYYIPAGEQVVISGEWLKPDKLAIINIIEKAGKKKIIDNGIINAVNQKLSFTMPASDIECLVEIKDAPKYKLNIDTSELVPGNIISVHSHDADGNPIRVSDGDSLFETQDVTLFADSVADNKKMLVKVTKTGTNEIVTGSAKGFSLEGIKNFFFRMFGFDTTVTVSEADRVGEGNQIYITETMGIRNVIDYSVVLDNGDEYSITSGDLAPAGATVKMNVNAMQNGSVLAVNVICPQANLVASGSNIDKPVFARRITGKGEYIFTMPDNLVEISVLEQAEEININSAEITLEKASYIFNADTIKPIITSVVLEDGTELIKDNDYTVSYGDNLNAGKGSVTITGIGAFVGSVTKEFDIKPMDLKAGVDIKVPEGVTYVRAKDYTVKPDVSIFGNLCVEGRDYKLEYSNNNKVTEEAIVRIIGLSNLSGTVEKTFAIIQKKEENKKFNFSNVLIKLDEASFEYDGSEIVPDYSITFENVPLVENIDYTLSILNNVNAGEAKLIFTGIGEFEGIQERTFEIKPRELDTDKLAVVVENMKFSSKVSTYIPKVFATYGEDTLAEGLDYTLSFSNNTTATENAIVTFKGVNNYVGTKEYTFKILKESLESKKLKINLSDKKFDYTGLPITPACTVNYKGQDLKEGTDYEIIYQNNIDAGKGQVVVVGINEYTGSKSADFKINPAKFADGMFDIYLEDQVFNGDCRPEPQIINKATGLPLDASNYTLSYKNNKKVADNAAVVIKGCNNYKGSMSVPFKITALKLDEFDLSIDDCSYTGGAIKPNITATHKTKDLVIPIVSDKAFKATYENNVELGTAKVIIKSKNPKYVNFGSATEIPLNFNIVKCNLETAQVSPIEDQQYKKGKEIKPAFTVFVGSAKLNKKLYTVDYKGTNTEKGIAKATIYSTDTTHFYGELTTQFAIK